MHTSFAPQTSSNYFKKQPSTRSGHFISTLDFKWGDLFSELSAALFGSEFLQQPLKNLVLAFEGKIKYSLCMFIF